MDRASGAVEQRRAIAGHSRQRRHLGSGEDTRPGDRGPARMQRGPAKSRKPLPNGRVAATRSGRRRNRLRSCGWCRTPDRRRAPQASKSRRPRSTPSQASTAAGSALARFGTTKPAFNPLAPAPMFSASRTATRTPRRARCKAAVRPVNPAPTTATSTAISPDNRCTGGRGAAVCHHTVRRYSERASLMLLADGRRVRS